MIIENSRQCEEVMRALSEYLIKTSSASDLHICRREAERCGEEMLNHMRNHQPVDGDLMGGLTAGAVILKDFPGMIQLWILSKISDNERKEQNK